MLTESDVQDRKDKAKYMDKMEKEQREVVVVEDSTVLSGTVENYWAIKLKNPITFEGTAYSEINLTGLENIKAADMVRINRQMTRNGSIAVTPELTLEYALNMANIATGLPLEFFDQLPPYAAIAVKERVVSFLYGKE